MRATLEFNPSALLNVIQGESTNKGAEFTALSTKTGKDFTFRLKRKFWNGNWFTFVYVERQYLEFLYLGFYTEGKIIYKGKQVTSDSAIAIAWCLRRAELHKSLEQVKFFHLGKCIKCGRTLTDSDSIQYGLGPKCRA